MWEGVVRYFGNLGPGATSSMAWRCGIGDRGVSLNFARLRRGASAVESSTAAAAGMTVRRKTVAKMAAPGGARYMGLVAMVALLTAGLLML